MWPFMSLITTELSGATAGARNIRPAWKPVLVQLMAPEVGLMDIRFGLKKTLLLLVRYRVPSAASAKPPLNCPSTSMGKFASWVPSGHSHIACLQPDSTKGRLS